MYLHTAAHQRSAHQHYCWPFILHSSPSCHGCTAVYVTPQECVDLLLHKWTKANSVVSLVKLSSSHYLQIIAKSIKSVTAYVIKILMSQSLYNCCYCTLCFCHNILTINFINNLCWLCVYHSIWKASPYHGVSIHMSQIHTSSYTLIPQYILECSYIPLHFFTSINICHYWTYSCVNIISLAKPNLWLCKSSVAG